MKKCSPVEMRENLKVVEIFKKEMIGFIAIPYTNQKEKNNLVVLLHREMDKIIIEVGD